MAKYAVADYLPLEARKAACEATYRPRRRSRRRLTDIGRCPLGVALHTMDPGCLSCVPNAHTVTQELIRDGIDRDQLSKAADAFINGWDSGRITDLYDALGVDREAVGE